MSSNSFVNLTMLCSSFEGFEVIYVIYILQRYRLPCVMRVGCIAYR